MIWYIIHNILKSFTPNMEPQHRNLTTFLTGVVLYTLFYSYIGTIGKEHTFVNVFFKYSIYIVMADAFAMAILYKNFYKQTIFKEVEETIGASSPKQNKCVNNSGRKMFFPKPHSPKQPEKERLPELLNESDCNENDKQEGFAKDSALGEMFTTNGESNN